MILVAILILLILMFHIKFDFKRIPIYFNSFIKFINFSFLMKSEDRLKIFKTIHEDYPRFQHIKIAKLLLVYDPEIAKKYFKISSNSYEIVIIIFQFEILFSCALKNF